MAKKYNNNNNNNINNDVVVSNTKQEEELRKEIITEIDQDVKDSIVKQVVSDVENIIETEYKNELKNKLTLEISNDVKEKIRKDQNKLIRRKNFKIFRLYIYVILLIASSCYLIYRLYDTGNLDIINKLAKDYNISNLTTTSTTTTKAVAKDFNTLLKEYKYLIDNLNITNNELLKGDFVIKDIDIKDKLAMAYKNLKSEEIVNEDLIFTVKEDSIKKSYIEIFGTEDGYDKSVFSVDGLNFVYSNINNVYMAIGKINNDQSIYHSITKIKEGKDEVKITAKVGIIKNNVLYNVMNLEEEIAKLEENEPTKEIIDTLSSVEYTFKKVNNNYILYSISKK